MDITRLIEDDHEQQRRLFAMLEEIDDKETDSLSAIWSHLAAFLDTHAEAEEQIFYPELLRVGRGADTKPDSAAETEDAIKDHNEIRDTVAKVAQYTVGTPEWRKAVSEANHANSDHAAEEERQGLADFRRNAPLALRHDLAVRFAAFEARHVTGVRPVDKDPKTYVAEHAPRNGGHAA